MLLLGLGLFLAWWSLIDYSQLAEFVVADLTVSIVIHSSEDSFDILTTWVESVPFQIRDKIWHADRMEAAGDLVEDSHLDEVRASSE